MTPSSRVQVEPLALSWRQVLAMIPLCRRAIEVRIARGEFPKPTHVGSKTLFDAAEVRAWWARTRGGEGAA